MTEIDASGTSMFSHRGRACGPAEGGSEREHLPAVDVDAAGGWKYPMSLKRAYQPADAETILSVVLRGGESGEKRA